MPYSSLGRRHSLENVGRRFFFSLVLTLLCFMKGERHVTLTVTPMMDRVICDIERQFGTGKVASGVTNNASNIKLAGDQLLLRHPCMLFYGCLAHQTNLLLKAMFKIPKLAEVLAKTMAIVKFVIKREALVYHIEQEQTSQQSQSRLFLPVDTR